jgi:general secretion pathway protein D
MARTCLFAVFLVVSGFLGKGMPLWSFETGPAGESLLPASDSADTAQGKTKYVEIDFEEVDIRVFIKAVSEITGKDFVVSPEVRGKVSVIAPEAIPAEEIYQVFQSVLEVHGFTAVPAGRIVKIVPSSGARGKGVDTQLIR